MFFVVGLLIIFGFILIAVGYVIGEKAIKNRDFDVLIFGLAFILFGLGVIGGSIIHYYGGRI